MKTENQVNLPDYINIPFFLYQDDTLDRTALLIAGFIYSLHTCGRTVNAKNKYLSEMTKVCDRKIYENLNILEKKNYIKRIGAGSRRQIKWIYTPESSITLIDDNSDYPADNGRVQKSEKYPADNGRDTLPTTAPIYTIDTNQQLSIEKTKICSKTLQEKPSAAKGKVNPIEYKETYFANVDLNNSSSAMEERRLSDLTFEAFFQEYPIKQAKSRAKECWYSQKCYKQFDEIIAKLREQKSRDAAFLGGFIAKPDKYILQEQWNDEIRGASNGKKEMAAPSKVINNRSEWITKRNNLLDEAYGL